MKKPETLRLEMRSWKEAEVYWIRVESPEDGAWLRDFSIYADVEAVREVNCAAVICTCRREKDVTANIDQIRKLSGEQRPEVFIIDNGNTLQDHVFPEFVSCIPNKNCGGAGGFTRGMLEVVKRKKFTHVILMDDDISLEPGVLERTRSFLSVLKDDSLMELFTAKDSQASSDAGTVISQLSGFRVSEMDDGFYRFSLESITGIRTGFLLHRTAEKEAS